MKTTVTRNCEGRQGKSSNTCFQKCSEKKEKRQSFLEQLERKAIEQAMKRCSGNVSSAAEMLGITRYALYRKLEKMNL